MSLTDFTSPVLSLELRGHVGIVWLDRPDALNALGIDFWNDFPRAIAALDADPEIRCIVLAAKGPHFCVGLDLKAMGGMLSNAGSGTASAAERAKETYRDIRRMQESVTCLEETNKPVLAAIHGYCIGGGVDLAAACEIRFASSDAIFSVREAKVAIVADLGSLQRLPRIMGAGHVAELAFTGKDIDASRAQRIGLVNDLAPDAAAVLHHTLEVANEIAANSPLAVEGTKAVLRAGDGASVEDGLEFVARWNTMYLKSHDLAEAMAAFMEKRAPNFTGT